MQIIETERLLLRKFESADLNDLFEYAKNPSVGSGAGWKPHESKEDSQKVLDSFMALGEVYALVYKAKNKVIGSLGLHNDQKREGVNCKMIGYALSESYWGKGLMTEAVKAAIHFVFETTDCEVVSCYHFPFNKRSENVIKKCGFHYEGTLRRAIAVQSGEIYDEACYSILREEYFKG